MSSELPDIGDKVSICGGNDNGIVIAIAYDKVLLLHLVTKQLIKFQYIVGRYPKMYQGELVWGQGKYFTPYGNLTIEQAICDAAKHYSDG